jgi:KR domain
MIFDQWLAANRPKVQGTLNLQNLLPRESLDFFIMLSSIVSIVGNSDQAGNSFLDILARHRNSKGLICALDQRRRG